MKAVKMNVELQRQLEEAEKEIEQKKAEEAARKEAEAKKPEVVRRAEPVKPVGAVEEEKPVVADQIFEQGKSFLIDNATYLISMVLVLIIALIGSFFAIGTGTKMIGGVGGADPTSGEVLFGIGYVLLGLVTPVAFVGVSYLMTANKNVSKLFVVIPMALALVVSVVFLFIA